MATCEIAEKWLDVTGIRTRYLEAGSGEPVVFIHGGHSGDPAMAESADVWDLAIRGLAGRYRCIAPDRLGQGATANPLTDDGYAMSAAIAHAIEFLEALGGEPAHLVGHAHGGYVAAATALQARGLVRSCTILSSELVASGDGNTELVLAGNPYAPLTRDSARFVIERSSPGREHVTPGWLDCVAAIFAMPKYRTAVARMVEAGLYDTVFLPRLRSDRDRLFEHLARASIGCPVMLFWGFDDPIAPLPMAYDAFDLFARHELRCELHIVNQSGRYAFRENSAAFHRILTNFVENVRHGV